MEGDEAQLTEPTLEEQRAREAPEIRAARVPAIEARPVLQSERPVGVDPSEAGLRVVRREGFSAARSHAEHANRTGKTGQVRESENSMPFGGQSWERSAWLIERASDGISAGDAWPPAAGGFEAVLLRCAEAK